MYFIGDNLLNILDTYGKGLAKGCDNDTKCHKAWEIISVICLIIGGVLFVVAFNKNVAVTSTIEDENKHDKVKSGLKILFFFLLNLPRFDAIYTGITTSIRLSNDCNNFHREYEAEYWLAYSLILAVLFVTMLMTLVLFDWCKSYTAPSPEQETVTAPSPKPGTVTAPSPEQGTVTAPSPEQGTVTAPSPEQGTVTAPSSEQGTVTDPSPEQGCYVICFKRVCLKIILAIVVTLIIGIFLLADNQFPLDCQLRNYMTILYNLRIILLVVLFCISLVLLIVTIVKRCKTV